MLALRAVPLVSLLFATAALAGDPVLATAALAGDPALWGSGGSGPEWETGEVAGRLVSRTDDAVIVRDGQGGLHTLRLTKHTRYVWTERSSPKDFAPGAKVRAEFDPAPASDPEGANRVAVALWILSGPGA